MTAASFLGTFLIGSSPPLSVFFHFVAQKPFLVVIFLSSTIFWLLSLLAAAALWRPFLPSPPSSLLLTALLSTSVLIQEAARLLLWKLYLTLEKLLADVAKAYGVAPLSLLDKVHIFISAGLGHAVAHLVCFFWSILLSSMGPATFYLPACPKLPIFALIAVISSGFVILHTSAMVASFLVFSNSPWPFSSSPFSLSSSSPPSSSSSSPSHFSTPPASFMLVPALHLAAALSLVLNLQKGGCLTGIPLTWLFVFIQLMHASWMVHQRGAKELSRRIMLDDIDN